MYTAEHKRLAGVNAAFLTITNTTIILFDNKKKYFGG